MIRGTSHHSVREVETLQELISGGQHLHGTTIQDLDLRSVGINWTTLSVKGCVFMGCELLPEDTLYLLSQGAIIFPSIEGIPYDCYRSSLYTWQELREKTPKGVTKDLSIYQHFSQERFSPSVTEALYQRLHDHAVDDALRDYLGPRGDNSYEQQCVGIMGGHGTHRTDPSFGKVVETAYLLSRAGYLVVSGGGPGIMEAANLGAYLGNYDREVLPVIIDRLAKAPHYLDKGYDQVAIDILRDYPDGRDSLAIPTWFYGHEPSNVFATHIAKYFSNSIREDNLLALCLHGIIFAPGSAGTTQEIFQDAAQNHYTTFDYISPMVFLGKDRYTKETNIYPTLLGLAKNKAYQKYLFLTETPEEALKAIQDHPPLPAK